MYWLETIPCPWKFRSGNAVYDEKVSWEHRTLLHWGRVWRSGYETTTDPLHGNRILEWDFLFASVPQVGLCGAFWDAPPPALCWSGVLGGEWCTFSLQDLQHMLSVGGGGVGGGAWEWGYKRWPACVQLAVLFFFVVVDFHSDLYSRLSTIRSSR